MAFWSDLKNTPEPLRQYRWYLQFGTNTSGSLDTIRYALMECGKPEMEITTSEHLLLNHYFKYPGVVKWKPINIKWASTKSSNGEEDASFILSDIITNSGYIIPAKNQTNHINKISMMNNISSEIELIQVNSNGDGIEFWRLYNSLITNIKYGTLSYASEDIVTIEATLNYDYAELSTTSDPKKQ